MAEETTGVHHDSLRQVIREMTEIAKVMKMFDQMSEQDASVAELPLIDPVGQTSSPEVNAVVNMFNVSVHVFSRHILRLQELGNEEDTLGRARRRRIAVLYFGLDASSNSFKRTEPEQVVDTLRHANTLFSRVIQKHGGTLIPQGATEFVALFGLDDNEDTAVFDAASCGMEILSALDQFNHFLARQKQRGLKMSAGVDYSDMIVGDFGSEQGAVPVTVGQALESAAELRRNAMGKPRPILLSENAARMLNGSILVEANVHVPTKDDLPRRKQSYEITQMPPHVDYRDLLNDLFNTESTLTQ